MTKNKLSDLNDHLFAQIERLSDEKLTGEALDRECKRGETVVGVADQIIRTAGLQLQAAKLVAEYGPRVVEHIPPQIEGPRPTLKAVAATTTK